MDDLIEILGEQLLRFMLAYDLPVLDESRLTAEQVKCTDVFRRLTTASANEKIMGRTVGLGNALLVYLRDRQTTAANACRLDCGGTLSELHTTSDQVLRPLLRLGRDVYAGLLLAAVDPQIHLDWALAGSVFRHPIQVHFCRAVLADSTLRALFPGASGNLDLNDTATRVSVQSWLSFSSGHGFSLQLTMVAERLLLAAYRRLLVNGPASLEAYLESLEKVLGDVRTLASRQPCEVTTIFGFANIEVPPDTSVDLAMGQFRSATSINRTLLPSQPDLSAVLVTTTTLELLDIESYDPATDAGADAVARFERFRPKLTEAFLETERIAELMRLAFLLASPPDHLFAVRNVCRTTLEPLQHRPIMQWQSATRFVASPVAEISSASLDRVKKNADLCGEFPRHLNIAMRRTLSAAVDRTDPYDGFIDAVLAWENLFSGRPETNLRVCGAIAWLLEPDHFARRTMLFNELKALYSKRSNLVHGAIDRIEQIEDCRDRAVRISVESLTRLHQLPELLRLKNSADRSNLIMMGRAAQVLDASAD